VSPIPKGSGKSTGRVKAHDGGDRQANSALWRIVMVRIAHDPATQLYFERRVKEGKTTHEVIRILKRYVAREVYRYASRLDPRAQGLAFPRSVVPRDWLSSDSPTLSSDPPSRKRVTQ
jgi:hypothetical protein